MLCRPSAESMPLSSPTTSSQTWLPGVQDERPVEHHVRGDGVSTSESTPGLTIGPRAENEYAVDPVGEATITPSAEKVVT